MIEDSILGYFFYQKMIIVLSLTITDVIIRIFILLLIIKNIKLPKILIFEGDQHQTKNILWKGIFNSKEFLVIFNGSNTSL